MVEKSLILFCLLITCQASPVDQAMEGKPAGSTTYDQRQTGKYNLHVNIKDVQFFSLSDSLASIGDYSDYGDYGDFEPIGDPDTDYDTAHLTVNPVFAFLGSQKPTTPKPIASSPVTEKLPSSLNESSSSSNESTLSSIKDEATTEKASSSSSSSANINKQDSESEIKDSTVYTTKPAPVDDKKTQQDEPIDYEEIPVEVQYYRQHHQKVASNGRNAINRFHKRQPSVQIIDGHGRGSGNVKILESDHPTVKICGRGEFRDNLGRCRVRSRRGANAPGL